MILLGQAQDMKFVGKGQSTEVANWKFTDPRGLKCKVELARLDLKMLKVISK